MKPYLNKIVVLIAFLFIFHLAEAQNRYWVFFTDKEGVEFDPLSYFDQKTVQKRTSMGIPLADENDLPVKEEYISAVKKISGKLNTVSRWFNAVSVSVPAGKMQEISRLPFVAAISPVTMTAGKTQKKPFKPEISVSVATLRLSQLASMGASFFEQSGIDGTGVRIAVFDGGFPGVDKSPVFDHLRENNRIIATRDFVRNREYVYSCNSHGTMVLTCIAGILDGKKFGMATGAEFLLARTEVNREAFFEEEYWLAAMEWADKNGADIINSSLGYTYHRYFQSQMDGTSTLVSRAATLAARKGMLVINAAGNDGSEYWQVIGAPADADSILSVGGINPNSGYKISFSSVGPTADGRFKPNISAFGKVATSDAKKLKTAHGTSFAAPLTTGFAACVKQLNPDWDNMKLYEEIQKAGHLYPYFDYAHGYGVPQAAFFTGNYQTPEPTFFFSTENDSVKIIFISEEYKEQLRLNETPESDKHDKVQPEYDKINDENGNSGRYNLDDRYLYFHLDDPANKILKRYAVMRIIKDTNYYSFPKSELEGMVLRVFYQGYVNEIIL